MKIYKELTKEELSLVMEKVMEDVFKPHQVNGDILVKIQRIIDFGGVWDTDVVNFVFNRKK